MLNLDVNFRFSPGWWYGMIFLGLTSFCIVGSEVTDETKRRVIIFSTEWAGIG